ncbi:MAG: UbiD family decarboxylase [Promethearchaeota archaeon]
MLNFRDYLSFLKDKELLTVYDDEVSTDVEIASLIHEHGDSPILFTSVKGSEIPVVSNIFGFRSAFSIATGSPFSEDDFKHKKPLPATNPASFINKLRQAIDNRSPPALLNAERAAPCQEIIEEPDFLEKLPILKHVEGDGGRYITSGVVMYTCPKFGRNISFHRMMVLGKDRLVARVVENRGLDTAMKESRADVDAAIVIGTWPHVMVCASTSPPKGIDELEIANSLEEITMVKCKTVNVEVPSESEIVIEGKFTTELAEEGPFLDLTGTLDITRQQPIFEVTCITHRKDAMYHALLPASREHEFLMGLPREATLLRELERFSYFKDVRLTPGSAHWFNAVVQVASDDAYKPVDVIQACFKGHSSLKNCVIVNEDVDIDDPIDIEFAITTRVQFDKNVYPFQGSRGSSLDPSANQETRETCKVGIDATIPKGKPVDAFKKITYRKKP